MKIIILSAGKGSRLTPLTDSTPKPLLQLDNGKTLLELQLDRIKKSGVIDKVVLVIGYKAEQIEAKIKSYKRKGYKIKTIYNPFINYSDNLVSLWLAKPEMNEDFMIMNGDNILESSVFRDINEKYSRGIILTTNVKKRYDEDDMKVVLKGKKILCVSKSIRSDVANAESIGLALVKGEYVQIFKKYLEQLIRNEKYLKSYWLEVFNVMNQNGVTVQSFKIDGRNKWREVDSNSDLDEINKWLCRNP